MLWINVFSFVFCYASSYIFSPSSFCKCHGIYKHVSMPKQNRNDMTKMFTLSIKSSKTQINSLFLTFETVRNIIKWNYWNCIHRMARYCLWFITPIPYDITDRDCVVIFMWLLPFLWPMNWCKLWLKMPRNSLVLWWAALDIERMWTTKNLVYGGKCITSFRFEAKIIHLENGTQNQRKIHDS